jgi:hypothetical protein
MKGRKNFVQLTHHLTRRTKCKVLRCIPNTRKEKNLNISFSVFRVLYNRVINENVCNNGNLTLKETDDRWSNF